MVFSSHWIEELDNLQIDVVQPNPRERTSPGIAAGQEWALMAVETLGSPTVQPRSTDHSACHGSEGVFEFRVDGGVVEAAGTVAIGAVAAEVFVAELVVLDAGFEALEFDVGGEADGLVDALARSVLDEDVGLS